MDLETFHALQTAIGAAALARAAELGPTDATLLACATQLRKEFLPEVARAALETVMLRRRASAKFTRAGEMFFTKEALEQSSGEAVSRYRAQRFAGFDAVSDYCCGIGGDTIALAGAHPVVAADADPLRLAMAGHNLRVYGLADKVSFISGDLLEVPLPTTAAAFFDPDRRAGGRRHVPLRHYQPPLDRLRGRLPRDIPLGVKLAPAIGWEELDNLDAEIEFISLGGELKEGVAWFGPLRTMRRRATLLPGPVTLAADVPARPVPAGRVGEYLYDPDPAILRAGLVADLAGAIGVRPIDEEIAYLTSDAPALTPFATLYRVEESHPFHAKRLAERLRSLKVGRVTITKRGSAVEPEALTRQLKLEGPGHRTIILTRAAGRPVMLIAERLSP